MNSTILDRLIDSIKKASAFNQTAQVSPAAVLWTDKERQWETVMPLLTGTFPHLLILGDYAPEAKTGPAIWLKCMIARALPEANWPELTVPIIYLPGVSRMELRAIESCPTELQPLAELQYRGTFWSQKNGKDWTLNAFLKSPEGGIGLDVAQDEKTLQALRRAFRYVLETPVDSLKGKRLEAQDFNLLLTADPVRDLLRWLDDPETTKKQWVNEEWEAYSALCKTEFSFSPSTDGELTGAEKLAHRQGPWAKVWQRYTESPQLYPKLPDLLRRTALPNDLFTDKSAWPQHNESQEGELRLSLEKLLECAPHDARFKVLELERQNAERRKSVWARLGQAPLAVALGHLATVAKGTQQAIIGDTPDNMAATYQQTGWLVDDAALKALSSVSRADDVKAIQTAIQSIYKPWLEDSAFRLQEAVAKSGYPANAANDDAKNGDLVLFVDGLRFDIGHNLMQQLGARGCDTLLAASWSDLPTVTSTAKPGVSPVAGQIAGTPECTDFVPNAAASAKTLTTHYFRKLLEDSGWQVVAKGEYGSADGKAWAEFGDFDHYGHEHGWKLARHIEVQLNELVEYVEALLSAGWLRIRIVTDHGWLLLPGGLPKADLPKCLTETRWGRCALVKGSATIDHQVVPWRWCTDVQVAIAPGIACFTSGKEYDHGGISLQECLIPVVTITRKAAKASAKIKDHTWRGLRCKVTIDGSAKGLKVDIRTKPADVLSSVANDGKLIDDGQNASLLIEKDELLGTAAVLVLVDQNGSVISKIPTTIGGDK